MVVLAATHLLSLYHGMYIHKVGQTVTLQQWMTSLAEDRLGFIPNFFDGLAARPEHIDIDIKSRNLQKLAARRQEAMERGRLVPSPDDWVPATIRHDGKLYRVSLRLKGDLSDHCKHEDLWSFKVKIKDNKRLFGMRRFALQDPRTRKHLNE